MKPPKPPRKPTLDSLKRSAAAYLERYAASAAMLRAVLERRVRRWARASGAEAEAERALSALVDEAVAVSARAGLVDDVRFAQARTATLIRKGWPERRIRAALGQKGVAAETAAAALAAAELDDAAAARRFAERRRLGPWRDSGRDSGRDPARRAERREKDIAALMRAGFSHGHARAAIDGGDAVTENSSDKLAD